jgi:predicted TIM-barrel fold metal-dependent hydrolase
MRCDSHVHVIGPIARYPQVATRTYLALPASLDALCRGAASSGIERFVIVQPSFYGTDNTVLLESLDVLGPRGRGVAVIDPAQTSKAMLDDCCARRMRPASQSLQPRQSEWRQDCPRLRGDRRLRASHDGMSR